MTGSDIYADLQRWRRTAGTHPDVSAPAVRSWDALLTQIIDETGYLASVTADERGQQAVPNVDKLRDRLHELSRDGVPTLATALRRLQTQAAADTHDPEASDAGENDGVQVLTVHEAKGQEYPVVAVPGVGRTFNTRGSVANGKVELETLGEDVLLGLKGPDPANGFEMTQTVLRAQAGAQRTREERAEEKRILYVACTRAQDHLLLSGRHSKASDAPRADWEIPVKGVDEDDPSSWRDWLQPILFDDADDAARWLELRANGSFTQTFDYTRVDPQAGAVTETGAVTVRLPPEFTPLERDTGSGDTALATEMTTTPPQPSRRFALSPHTLSQLAAGEMQLTLDADPNLVTAQPVETDEQATPSSTGLPGFVRGQAVHRLCEVRPPRSDWRAVIDQVVADERQQEGPIPDPTDVEYDAISEQAAAAMSYVDELQTQLETVGVYDEFPLRVTLDSGAVRGDLSGFIDQLIVTPAAYHVVDYKTDTKPSAQSVESFLTERASHHSPQVMAYAAALQQLDSTRAVHVHLYFTDVAQAYTWKRRRDGYVAIFGQWESPKLIAECTASSAICTVA